MNSCLQVDLFGESHGSCIGVLIRNFPFGVKIDFRQVNAELARRRPGQSALTTARKEDDRPEFISGIFNGCTTGAPIVVIIRNKDADSSSYEKIRWTPRPSHADYPAHVRYQGFNDYRGGGMFSGRLTAGYVIAGALAKQVLKKQGITLKAELVEVGGVKGTGKFSKVILAAKEKGDSVDGLVRCTVAGVKAGIGDGLEPLDGALAGALFNIPGVKGIWFGDTKHRGSENNDPYRMKNGKVVTLTNHCGGILGGISTGMPIVFTVHVKPTSSIAKEQKTINLKTMKDDVIQVGGRHDSCIAVRVPVIVESLAAIVILGNLLRQR